MRIKIAVLGLVLAVIAASPASAQPGAELRGFWVDTFNSHFNNQADVVAMVDKALAANANALFAQVRRRGDVWFLSSHESLSDLVPIEPGFDPLGALTIEARARGLQVHAFVAVNAIFGRHPVVLGVPNDPNHVFNRHGGFDAATGTIVPGPDNWLTRTLLPGIAFNGHRFGNDFWIDPGHPDAVRHTVELLSELVDRYDIDGLHLDRIRYPEISVAGQTPSTGANVGYNVVSVARFQQRYGIAPDAPPPPPSDPLWSQWRRDQVTNLVRRVYLETIARKPEVVVSAATIAFGNGPSSWPVAEAYWRVYQDWRAWTEEGIIDLNVLMNYKTEHSVAGATAFDQWLAFLREHQYGRAAAIGQGNFLNAVEGSLRQSRRSLQASDRPFAGVVFFSMANPDMAVANNPYALPTAGPTPVRGIAEFASAYTTGGSVDGAERYEDAGLYPLGLFAAPAPPPVFAWKASPRTGHLKGIVSTLLGGVVDAGDVLLLRKADGTTPTDGRSEVQTATDGNGFYGGVDLAAGTYSVIITPTGGMPYTSCPVDVTTGAVATLDVTVDPHAPTTTVTATPDRLWPNNGAMIPVTIRGTAEDTGLGLASVEVRVVDEYGEITPAPVVIDLSGLTSEWSVQVALRAKRRGTDRDGRAYTVVATVTDRGCTSASAQTQVIVPHNQGTE